MFNMMHPHSGYQSLAKHTEEYDLGYLRHEILLCRLQCALRKISFQFNMSMPARPMVHSIAMDNLTTEVVSISPHVCPTLFDLVSSSAP